MSNTNYVGNISTIIKYLVCMIFPYCTVLGVTESQLTAIITLIIGFVFAYIDSKYPNTFKFLDNLTCPNCKVETTETETEE